MPGGGLNDMSKELVDAIRDLAQQERERAAREQAQALRQSNPGVFNAIANMPAGTPSGSLGSAPLGGTGGGPGTFSPTGGFGLASVGHALHQAGGASPALGALGTLATGAAAGPAGFAVAALGLAASAAGTAIGANQNIENAGFAAFAGASGLTAGQAAELEARTKQHTAFKERLDLTTKGSYVFGRYDPVSGKGFGYSGQAPKEANDAAQGMSEEEQFKQKLYERNLDAEQNARAIVEHRYARAMKYGSVNDEAITRSFERELAWERRLANARNHNDVLFDKVRSLPDADRQRAGAVGGAAKRANGQ